jgi:S1-C subfamily serine protease
MKTLAEPWRTVAVLLANFLLVLAGVKVATSDFGCTPVPTPPTQPQPQPDPGPSPSADPVKAIGKLAMSGGYCSATVVGRPSPDGRRTIVTAAHCVKRGVGERVRFYSRDNGTLPIPCTVTAVDREADIAILATDAPAPDLTWIEVAESTPPVGTVVLHAGFGRDRPSNVEKGTVTSGVMRDGMVRYKLSVSPGDSGGGICVTAAGKLLSPVCCTSSFGPAVGDTYGGSPERIRKLLAQPAELEELQPVEMPPVPKS